MKTLYVNENVTLWDAETDEQEKIKLAQEEEDVLQAIEEGRILAQLKNHSGYTILQTYLINSIQDCKHKLTLETDYKKFRRLQEAAKAYTNVLGFVEFKIQEGLALEQTRQTPEEG